MIWRLQCQTDCQYDVQEKVDSSTADVRVILIHYLNAHKYLINIG